MNLNIENIGVWGFHHYEYLKQEQPIIIYVMRMKAISNTPTYRKHTFLIGKSNYELRRS